MDNERIREICLALPHVTETVNWGHHLVYWAGDRDIGGKMFAMTDLDGAGIGVLWFHCGAERFHELLEREGICASPYLAKAHWVNKAILALPEKERAKAIRERKKKLVARTKAPSKPSTAEATSRAARTRPKKPR
jgi:predicted DNA-binding protein (MmcQ/YjbR family)